MEKENKTKKKGIINNMENKLKTNSKRVAVTLLVLATLGLGYTTSKYSQEALEKQEVITEQREVIADKERTERDLKLSNSEGKKKTEGLELEKNKLSEALGEKDKKNKELTNKVEELNNSLKIKREKQLAEANKVEKAKAVEVKKTSANPDTKVAVAKPVAKQGPKKESQPVAKAETNKADSAPTKQEEVKTNSNKGTNFKATFYAIGDGYTPGTVTANGTDVSSTIYSPEGYRIIAVDTSVIPMNSLVKVTYNGNTFVAKASDTGSAINGNKIDILIDSPGQANANGLVDVHVERM